LHERAPARYARAGDEAGCRGQPLDGFNGPRSVNNHDDMIDPQLGEGRAALGDRCRSFVGPRPLPTVFSI
jgi:hypothetical protein